MKKWKFIVLMTLLYLLIAVIVKSIGFLAYQDVETGWANALIKDLPVFLITGLVLSFVFWSMRKETRKKKVEE